MSTTRILLVEDDLRLSELIQDYLSQQGFLVLTEPRGDTGLERIIAEQPDLVVLDLMLPGMDGLTVCRKARQDYDGPVLMLTAREDDTDQVVGLELGADDYVKKPVEPRLLLARIRAMLRRYDRASRTNSNSLYRASETEELVFDTLRLDKAAQEVSLAGKSVNLTTNEFFLLWTLASYGGHTLDRETLFKKTRGISYDGIDRSIDISISRLRKKLGDSTEKPWRIKTVWGQGYLFVKNAWAATTNKVD